LGVLRKAAAAVQAILNDPIGFLRNLVAAVGAGLRQFLKNIVKHLQQGLVTWLLGITASVGIQLPTKFDIKGILLLIASLLGLTWLLSPPNPASASIRACKLIIDIVRFVVERGRQIIDFVNAVLDAVLAIARDGGGGVPGLVENALARSIPVLIGFLASLLGIG